MKCKSKSIVLVIQKLLKNLIYNKGKYKDINEGVIHLKLLENQLREGSEDNDTRPS